MLRAKSVMTRDVAAVRADATVGEVARTLAERGGSAAPVCDASGVLVGMISEGDLLRPFLTSADKRRDWWLELLADGADLAPEFLSYIRRDHRRAADLMAHSVIVVTEDTPLADVAELLTRNRIKRVPVLRDGRVVGIVSRADLVRALAGTPEALSETLA